MDYNEKRTKLISCSHCHKYFRADQLIVKKRKFYDKEIDEEYCPYCGSVGHTAKHDETVLDKKTYFYLSYERKPRA